MISWKYHRIYVIHISFYGLVPSWNTPVSQRWAVGLIPPPCIHPACPSLPRRCYKPERAELRAHLTDVVSGLNGATVGWPSWRGLSKTPTAITYPTKISLKLGRLFGKLEKLGDRLTGHISILIWARRKFRLWVRNKMKQTTRVFVADLLGWMKKKGLVLLLLTMFCSKNIWVVLKYRTWVYFVFKTLFHL